MRLHITHISGYRLRAVAREQDHVDNERKDKIRQRSRRGDQSSLVQRFEEEHAGAFLGLELLDTLEVGCGRGDILVAKEFHITAQRQP